jgi:hypothetical protein
MQKQLEALSFLDKRKATKQKLVTDQVTSASGAPPVSDQVIVPAQQQTSGYWLLPLTHNCNLEKNLKLCQLIVFAYLQWLHLAKFLLQKL